MLWFFAGMNFVFIVETILIKSQIGASLNF